MKVFFSPEYSGVTYLKEPAGKPVVIDGAVMNTSGLLALLEFRLGLRYDETPVHRRLTDYYNAMRSYISANPESVLAGSFKVSGLATAKAVLGWRDALKLARWDFKEPYYSRRLKALGAIENIFSRLAGGSAVQSPDTADRIISIEVEIGKYPDLCKDLTIEVPFDYDLMHPSCVALLKYSGAVDGVHR